MTLPFPPHLMLSDLRRAAAYSAAAYRDATAVELDALRQWGVDVLKVVEVANCRALVGYGSILGELTIAFAGTDDFFDMLMCSNLLPCRYLPRPGGSDGVDPDAYVHTGFETALNTIWEGVERAIDEIEAAHKVDYVLVTGHSLGGAMAHLAAVRLTVPPWAVITFGMPRVGCKHWVKTLESRVPLAVRVVHDYDDIPHVPAYPYQHATHLLHLDSKGEPLSVAGSWWRSIVHTLQGLLRYPKAGITDHLMAKYVRVLGCVSPTWKFPS